MERCHAPSPATGSAGLSLACHPPGVNRTAVFLESDDHAAYLDVLRAAFERFEVALHAYVLMTNHVHLLVSSEVAGAVSRALCVVGRDYVPRFNRKHGRTGTLWEGRFKSSLVDTEGYLLRVYRYIELNPVRAAMVDDPERYPWSSVHGNLGTRVDDALTPHPSIVATFGDRRSWIGATNDGYRAWLREGIGDDELVAIRAHMRQERALGSARFQQMVSETLQRPSTIRPRGRPRRRVNEEPSSDSNGYQLWPHLVGLASGLAQAECVRWDDGADRGVRDFQNDALVAPGTVHRPKPLRLTR